MDVNIVDLPDFKIIGFRTELNLNEFDSGIGKEKYQLLLARKAEIQNKAHDYIVLYQQYPEKKNFNPHKDRFVQIIGYVVENAGDIPEGMMLQQVPGGKFAKATHKGLEKNLQRSYNFLYGLWMKSTGNTSSLFDFEIWDDRYKPDLPENQIDIFVGLL